MRVGKGKILKMANKKNLAKAGVVVKREKEWQGWEEREYVEDQEIG